MYAAFPNPIQAMEKPVVVRLPLQVVVAAAAVVVVVVVHPSRAVAVTERKDHREEDHEYWHRVESKQASTAHLLL